MGTRYSTIAVSGYNASPPSDDGSTSSTNQVSWATQLTKIGNPLKTMAESINSALVTALGTTCRSVTSSDSTVASDHWRTVEIASTVTAAITISLADAATMANGYIVTVANQSAIPHTIGRVTASNTINTTTQNISILPFSAITFIVTSGGTNYATLSSSSATLGTPVATTSGTSIDFTGIPAGVKEIKINFAGVSTNNTSPFLIQIGDSGGVEPSGYVSGGASISGGTIAASTAGFIVGDAQVAARLHSGTITLSLENASGFTWCASGMVARDSDGNIYTTAGHKSLSAVLDRVRITTVAGTATFDAGEINISYE
jgi:hypothetical protein